MRKALRFIVLAALLLVAIQPAYGQSDETKIVVKPGDSIMMAVVGDMSYQIPEFGQDIANSAQIAVNDVNAAGGIKGWQVVLNVEDDRCTPDDATTVASRIASNPQMAAVVGHICSGPTLAAVEIYEKALIPMVSASATNALLTSQGFTVFNRTAPSDEIQAKVGANYMFTVLGFRKIAVLHDNQLYGQALAQGVKDEFEALGGEVVAFEGINIADSDFRPVFTPLVAEAPEAIYFGGYVQAAVLLVPQKNDVGLQDTVFFTDEGVFGQDFIDGAGDAAEGVYASSPFPVELSAEAAEVQKTAQTAFLDEYKAAFGIDPMSPYYFNAYDAARLLLLAMDQVAVVDDAGNLVIDRAELVKAIREIKDYAGLTGILTCSASGECGSFIMGVNQVQDGEWVRLELPQELIDMQLPPQ